MAVSGIPRKLQTETTYMYTCFRQSGLHMSDCLLVLPYQNRSRKRIEAWALFMNSYI